MRSLLTSRPSRRRSRPLRLERLESRVVPSLVAPLSFDAWDGAYSVSASEFNGDGLPDLAVANPHSNTVSVFLGNGDGTFQAARTFATQLLPSSVPVGDFNGDGLA